MIHQCVHGYRNGHELLASSLTLTKEQRTILGQATDLSGPAPVEGFDGYVSGFPLPGEFYVLAKTWYAPELARPGCVWTHSLLLGPESTGLLELQAFARVWHRPSLSEGFESYGKAIATVSLRRTPPNIPIAVLEPTIEATYADSGLRTCVMTESSEAVEAAFLALWNQQWPQLRRTFSFTTGLLGTGARPFDLQAIPNKNRRLFLQRQGFKVIAPTLDIASADEWARIAASDATDVADRGPTLRVFLWEFGRTFHDGRSAFRPLCHVFQGVTAREAAARVTAVHAAIREHFPNADEAIELKRALLGDERTVWSLPEPDALEIMVRDQSGALVLSDAVFSERVERLPTSELEQVASRVKNAPPSRRAAALLGVYFARYEREHPGISETVPAVIDAESLNETIAYGLLYSNARRLLHATRHGSAESWIRASDRLSETSDVNGEVEECVLNQLWNHREHLREYLQAQSIGRFLKYTATVFDVSKYEAEQFPLSRVREVEELPSLHDRGADLHACAFLTMLGLVRNDVSAAYCMREGFSTIYWAAKEQRLPWDLWRALETQTPWHFLEWDRCARLIEGAVRRFVDRDWTAYQFGRTFRTDEEFNRAVAALDRVRSDSATRLRDAVCAERGR